MLQLPQQTENRRSTPRTDPVLVLIERQSALRADWLKIVEELDEAEHSARKKFGGRPFTLIAWRNYSAIGWSEIDDRREEFLNRGIDAATVEAEYADAKKRHRKAERAAADWDRRAGIADLRKRAEAALSASRRCETRLGRTKPTTVAGAAALLQCVLDDDLCGDEGHWHVEAIKSATVALRQLSES